MEQRRIPGLVLAIVKNGNAIKHDAYGVANLELNAPARKETAFEIVPSPNSLPPRSSSC